MLNKIKIMILIDNLINEIYKEKQKLLNKENIKKADLNNLIIYKNDNDNILWEVMKMARKKK
ncbi:hypothetical protein HYD75_02990 [Mycoplasmopsis bovis]|nr:hypothetical protein HYD75_02990 [Mycoplasmopsis bovis]